MIKFLNILIIEYVDFIMTIKNCYDSDPKVTNERVDGILTKYKRRVILLKRCYDSIENGGGANFLKYCWFICQTFHWNKMSPIFEGDLKMIKRLFFSLYSFVRKARNEEEELQALSLIHKRKGNLEPSEMRDY